tara:strand:- start:21511 stop:21636 length:126 start_codon:yes stop_codon:yes gene_type:complete
MEIIETFLSIAVMGGFFSFFVMAVCIGFAETIDENHPDALK